MQNPCKCSFSWETQETETMAAFAAQISQRQPETGRPAGFGVGTPAELGLDSREVNGAEGFSSLPSRYSICCLLPRVFLGHLF